MLQIVARNRITRSDLQEFTQRVADAFNAGEIHAPVHLSGGNEDQLIDIFSEIAPTDWVCSTWRSHYHAILKNIPQEQLMSDIRAGRSISLCYPEHRLISSAIVAGCLPIAVGLAWSIKNAEKDEHVWAFCGDMAATTGIFSECTRYAESYRLPVTFIIEDNGKSVCTNTKQVWNGQHDNWQSNVRYYSYKLPWPHSGAGKRVNF
jgi:TPP-dependent pyruvate/acetoin dehydrogenase alpha subunit